MFKHHFITWIAPVAASLALLLTTETGWAQHRGGHAAPAHAAAHHASFHAPAHHATFHAPMHAAFHAPAHHAAVARSIHHAPVANHAGFRGGVRAPAFHATTHAGVRPYAARGYAHPYGNRGWNRYGYRYPFRYGGYGLAWPWGYPYGYANNAYPYYSGLNDFYANDANYGYDPYDSYFVGPSAALDDSGTEAAVPDSVAVAPTTAATLRVVLPSYGTVWIDSYKTEQGAGARDFVTPPLTVGQDFTYHVSAQFTQNGLDLTRSKDVIIHAGELVTVDFTQPNS